jgi:hypothetical protein
MGKKKMRRRRGKRNRSSHSALNTSIHSWGDICICRTTLARRKNWGWKGRGWGSARRKEGGKGGDESAKHD